GGKKQKEIHTAFSWEMELYSRQFAAMSEIRVSNIRVYSCPFVVQPSQQILIRQKQSAKVFHHAHRVVALGNFRKAKTGEPDFVQPRQQFAEWIFVEIQVAHVDGKDFVLHQVEIVVEALADEVGLVRIPAHTDVAVTGGVHDGFDVRQQRGLRAVHFEHQN